jgi:hypothetical protein
LNSSYRYDNGYARIESTVSTSTPNNGGLAITTRGLLTLLNLCGDQLNDDAYSLLMMTQGGAQFGLATAKQQLTNSLMEKWKAALSVKVTSSPYFSLILRANSNMTLISVYISYVDSREFIKKTLVNSRPKPVVREHLIRIINLGRLSDVNNPLTCKKHMPSVWSKLLFEQIYKNIIDANSFNRKNLICLSIDTRILDRLCYDSFQYLCNINTERVIIVPLFNLSTTFSKLIVNFNFENSSSPHQPRTIRDYLILFDKLIKAIKLTSDKNWLNEFKVNEQSAEFSDLVKEFTSVSSISELGEKCFSAQSLPNLQISLGSIYTNYPKLMNFLKISSEKLDQSPIPLIYSTDGLRNLYCRLNSIESYFFLCMLCDTTKLIHEYQSNIKKMCSQVGLKMPWQTQRDSRLHYLYTKQLKEHDDNSEAIRSDSPNSESNAINTNVKTSTGIFTSTLPHIEYDKAYLENLEEMKFAFEKQLASILDVGSINSIKRQEYSYMYAQNELELANLITGVETGQEASYLMIDVYLALIRLFELTPEQLTKSSSSTSSVFKVKKTLSTQQIEIIISFYFRKIHCNNEQFIDEYNAFLNKFLEIKEVDAELRRLIAIDEVSNDSSLLQDNLNMQRLFIEYVNQFQSSNNLQIIKFLAGIYLVLPNLFEFNEEHHLLSESSSLDIELLEQRLKLETSLIKAERPVENRFDFEYMFDLTALLS